MFVCSVFFLSNESGTLRLSESESEPTTPSAYPTHSAKSTKPMIPLDALSSDYADMTLGSSKSSMRNTGPTLSPKENIKKLKSSFFGCGKINENKMDCSNTGTGASSSKPTTPPVTVTTNSKNSTCDEGDYTIMNPVLNKRTVTQQPQVQQPAPTPFSLKKTALVSTNNDPDKVLANTQVKTSIDGFKPITSRADKEVFQQNKSICTASTSFGRQHSAPAEKQRHPSTDSGAYEMLELRSSSSSHSMGGIRIARPNSVNSEKTTFTPLNRPNSANSERQSTSTFSLTSTPLNEMGAQSVCTMTCYFILLSRSYFIYVNAKKKKTATKTATRTATTTFC